jgi:hypothetical protein
LLGISKDSNTKAVSEFMAALLNVKQCNTLIRKLRVTGFIPT